MSFLEVKNLSKTYTTKEFFGEKKFLALDNVSFSVKEGEFLSVIGSSGSGKTTLGRIIADILDYDGGTVEYYGKPLKEYGINEFSSISQMVFQNPYASLDPKMRIKSSLMEALKGKKYDEVEDTVKSALEQVGLEPKILDNYPHQFSGGQRQRIAVARALLKKPKLIVADEPFASLDMYSQNQIMRIFESIKQNTSASIILITHDIAAAAKFAERMIIMEQGKILKDDTSKNIFNEKENKYIVDLISSMEL